MAEGAAAQGVKRYPRDLLRQFSGGVRQVEPLAAAFAAATEEEDSGEIELSLGLSLGGCFGVDPARRSGLHRSSSVAAIPILQQGEGDPGDLTLLKRTSSLPAEAEEEQRKRRELQCLRRMEAKRRRSEKVGGAWEGDGGTGWVERPEIGWWVPPNASAAAAEGARGFAPASQGSVGSQGSSSSGASDFGGRPPNQEELLGNGTGQWRNPSRTQSLPALTEHNLPAVGKTMNYAASREEVVNSSPQKESAVAGTNGGDGVMEEMPWVSTKGGDPNGRKVEGFLYRYGKGQEVRIVCICHGHFLSPAEFVRHAGGGDVTHPLKHIMVSTSPSSFL